MIDADSFEERVRATAALLWNRPAEKDRIAGVNLDCVLKIHSGHWVIVEITTEHTLDKVRGDINRLSMVRLAKFTNDQVVSDCYLVMFRPPTQSMIDAGKELHIRVRSYRRFERSFFDYASYAVERHKLQFGSAVHPLTGEPDNSEYVPVAYRFDKKGTDDGISRLLDLIRRGKKIVLLGEYGSGKSRCLRELFSRLTFDSQPPPEYYFLAIDLRRAWGLQSANEIIRRHLEELGLAASGDRVIRAASAGRVCFLLDGFDELGSQAWSDNALRLQNIRFEALKGIRELIGKNKGGMLICGREHYFNSQDELYRSLDLSPGETEVVRCNDEFSEDEMERFLESLGVLVDVPGWLPKRPLMCQAIANLEPQDLIRMFDEDGGDVEFWHKFMSIVSERESRIRSSLDPKTIVLVLQELAHMTRAKPANVGPLSLSLKFNGHSREYLATSLSRERLLCFNDCRDLAVRKWNPTTGSS
jgi:NACHT domain